MIDLTRKCFGLYYVDINSRSVFLSVTGSLFSAMEKEIGKTQTPSVQKDFSSFLRGGGDFVFPEHICAALRADDEQHVFLADIHSAWLWNDWNMRGRKKVSFFVGFWLSSISYMSIDDLKKAEKNIDKWRV